jgi:sulfatase maturation enzyme AslB (radical SAM superfamily)
MNRAPDFADLTLLESSEWLRNIKNKFHHNQWPEECVRCQQTESVNGTSIRLNSNTFHKSQTLENYLIVGGVLDNICNSACQTCNAHLSTKIGALESGSNYVVVDNANAFWNLPLERIVHLDINGGEPSASKNYRHLLANLPVNVKSLRLNTNCSRVIPELTDIQGRGIQVTVTVSLDGIEKVHDYVRWPIKWHKFYENLMAYQSMNLHELNTWTTVSALNIGDFSNIKKFVFEHGLLHSWAFLNQPDPLNVKYRNNLTMPHYDVIPGHVAIDRNNQTEIDSYIRTQNQLRNIK